MKRSEKAGPKFRVELSKAEAERIRDLLKADGHDYEYAQAGCTLCKLHKRLFKKLLSWVRQNPFI